MYIWFVEHEGNFDVCGWLTATKCPVTDMLGNRIADQHDGL